MKQDIHLCISNVYQTCSEHSSFSFKLWHITACFAKWPSLTVYHQARCFRGTKSTKLEHFKGHQGNDMGQQMRLCQLPPWSIRPGLLYSLVSSKFVSSDDIYGHGIMQSDCVHRVLFDYLVVDPSGFFFFFFVSFLLHLVRWYKVQYYQPCTILLERPYCTLLTSPYQFHLPCVHKEILLPLSTSRTPQNMHTDICIYRYKCPYFLT